MADDTLVAGEVEIAVRANLDRLRDAVAQAEVEGRKIGAAFDQSASQQSSSVTTMVNNVKKLTVTVDQLNQNLNVRDNFNSAARSADIAAYGQELDRVAAKIDPLFAAQRRYTGAVNEAQAALRVGAISQEQYAMAALRAQAALDYETDAIQRANAALLVNHGQAKMNALQMQNMQFQINDLAMGLMTGANPFVLITQQGLQIAQIFKPGGGVMGALRQFGQGVLSFVLNPVNLAVVGIAAAVWAATSLWSSMTSDKEKDAESALQRHSEYINDILLGYEGAQKAAEDYIEKSRQLSAPVAISESRTFRQDLLNEYDAKLQQIFSHLQMFDTLDIPIDYQFGEGSDRLIELINLLRDGQISLQDFKTEADKIRLNPDNDKIRELAAVLSQAAAEALGLKLEIGGVEEAIRSLQGATLIEDTFGALDGTAKALEQIRALTPDLRTAAEKVRDIVDANSAMGTDLAQNAELVAAGEYAIQQIAEQERRTKALAAAKKAAAQAERDLQQAQENAAYIADLQREVAILQLGTEERREQLALLEQDRAVQAAIKSLGSAATAEQIAMLQQLIPLKMQLEAANEEEEASLQRQLDLYNQLGSTVGSIFAEWLSGAKTAEEAMWELAKAAAMAALQSMFLGQSNNSWLGSDSFLGNFLSGLFGGMRAGGGPVEAGKVYKVNENTANSEYWMPSTDGYVIPNNRVTANTGSQDGMGDQHVYIYLEGANGDATIRSIVEESAAASFRALPGHVQRIIVDGKQRRKLGFV